MGGEEPATLGLIRPFKLPGILGDVVIGGSRAEATPRGLQEAEPPLFPFLLQSSLNIPVASIFTG